MKKLMFAAALALGASCFADSIESNVVGYNNYEAQSGFNLYAPMFTSTSGTTLKINDIKLIGAGGWGLDSIQTLDEDGIVDFERYYTWCNEYNTPDNSGVVGWYHTMGTKQGQKVADDIILNASECLYVYIDGATAEAVDGIVSVSCAGNVSLAKIDLPLGSGFNLIGNTKPVEVKVNDVKLVNVGGWGLDSIQTLDENGIVDFERYYTWCNEYNTPDNSGVVGWYHTMGTRQGQKVADDVKLQPGDGLYLYIDGATVEGDPRITIE